jgi:hypothetical protein
MAWWVQRPTIVSDEPPERRNSDVSDGGKQLDALVRRAAWDETSTTGPGGQRVSRGGLLNIGLTRRQTLSVLGLVASRGMADVAIGQAVEGGEPDAATASEDRLVALQDGRVVAVGPSLEGSAVRLRTDPVGYIIYDGPPSAVTVEGVGKTGRCHRLSAFTSVG